MENYQLYRTNILLGGQMKYDVVLKGSNDTNLYIDSLNITPISDTIPYDRYNKSYWVSNYSFAESIKKFYHQTSGYFYDTNIDPILSQSAPLSEKYTGTTYDDRYEMGCRRMNYSLYNKQLSFFCPIWLEKLNVDDGDYLLFEFSFYSNEEQTKELGKSHLKLKNTDTVKQGTRKLQHIPGIDAVRLDERSNHDKYVDSFEEFIDLLGIKSGDDTIINLSLDGNSTLHAFNVSTGKCVSTKTGSADDIKLPNLHDLLTRQQRILLEQNQLIINNLKDNLCIAKQLFNFNFCFNPTDILPRFVVNELKSESVYISVQVYINNDSKNTSTKLELRDFYSNHEYIQRKVVTPKYIVYDVNNDNAYVSSGKVPSLTIEKNEPSEQYNVLSYYNDHRYINTIDKNKILQSIIHWAPVNNRHEILNFYPGFMSCHKIKHPQGEIIESVYNGYNMGTPQLDISSYSRQSNPYWCNAITLLLNMDNELVKKIGEEEYTLPVNSELSDDQITELLIDTPKTIQDRFEEFVMSSLEDILINAEEKYHYLYSTFSKDCYVRNIHYKDTSSTNYFNMIDHVNILFVNIANYLESESSSNFVIDISKRLREHLIKRYSNLITCTRYFSKYDGSSDKFVAFDAIRYNDYVIILYVGDKPETSTTHSNLTEQFAEDLVYNNFMNLFVGKINASSYDSLASQIKDFTKNRTMTDDSRDIYMRFFHRIINFPVKSDFKYLRINTGLKNIPTVGPTMNIKEIDLLHTNQNSVIYRTLGHISPMFISPDNDLLFNYKYNKFKLSYKVTDDADTGGAVQNISILPKPVKGGDNEHYINYINNTFPPLYPSIGYFKYYKDKQSYNQPIQDTIGEYHSMNCNKVYFLTAEIQVEIDQSIIDSNENGLYEENYTDIDELIKKYIIDYYKTDFIDSKELEYIVSLYNYTYNLLDVFIDDNGNQVYKYDVKIKLK